MTVYLRTSEVIGLPVVTVAGGEDVAEIRDVVYAGEEGSLLGFTLNRRGFLRGRMREVLPADSVSAIGSAAVMIADEQECLVSAADAPDAVGAPPTDRNVLGNAVLTDGGIRLGTVTDLVLAVGGRGEIIGYELQREGTEESWFIPRPEQLAVSGDALLVPAAIEDFISKDLSEFALALDRYTSEAAS